MIQASQKSVPSKNRGDGRVVFLLACLMLGGALFMFGKTWFEKYTQESPIDTAAESGLTGLHFISAENILDRIRKGEDIKFIDIRPRTSYRQNHLLDSEWIGIAETASFSVPTGQLVVIVHGEENSNDELRDIHEQFTSKQMTFAFLEGGIQNWINKGGAVISQANPDSVIDQTKNIPILPEQVTPLRETLVRSTIIDVRSESEYRAGHIPSSINLPLDQLEKRRSTLPNIGSLFVYGASNDDTFQAGTRLFDMGFIGLRIITGGFTAWTEKGLPVEPST